MDRLYDDLEPILDFALGLHDLGFSITPPIPPSGRFPLLPWKPYQTTRASKAQLIEWAFEYPYFNYGVITGSLSGVICLDADNPDAEAVIAKHCPPTPMMQLSGSRRGKHYVYKHPGTHVPTKTSIEVHGVSIVGLDLRGDGGLFIGPGSVHRVSLQSYVVVEPWTKELLNSVPVFDLTWLGLTVEAKKTQEPSSDGSHIGLNRRQELAREMLMQKGPARSGENSEGYCLALASALVNGYDLSPEEAEDIFLEWGEKEGNIDSEGRFWTQKQLRHKLEDAALQDDLQGRPRGYLLPSIDYKAVKDLFSRRATKNLIGVHEYEKVPPGEPVYGPEDHTIPYRLPTEEQSPSCPPEAQSGPGTSVPSDELDGSAQRFANDPRTAYLWKGNHAKDANVKPQERLARAKSVLEVYRLIPQSGLLADFLASYLPTTDCSCTLLLGAGLALSASLVNRRAWIAQGSKRLYPHLGVA